MALVASLSHRPAYHRNSQQVQANPAAPCGTVRRVAAPDFAAQLHRILQRNCTGFCSALEIRIGDLEIVFLGDQRIFKAAVREENHLMKVAS
jgi:hypothetical protein